MNSSSKVVMVVSLIMVLSLVLVLLAELYCSLLLRRRRHTSLNLPITTVPTAATTTTTLNQVISTTSNDSTSPSNINSSSPNPLYTGVLQTPTKTHFHLILSTQVFFKLQPEPFLQASLDLIQETIVNDSGDNFIYISNPMYSNEATSKPTTPFETPESSPSRLETGESSSSSSSGEEEDNDIIEVSTPTLAPMKDLTEKACSVSLKKVETSASESNSLSGSPYTSPSW